VFTRPAAGCQVADDELAGLPTRVFTPATLVAGRTVLYLHGGGFILYARRTYTPFLSRLAIALRARVVVPAYRLAPEHPFPAGIDDCLLAYEALIDAGQDPRQVIIAGESAGANATLVTVQRIRAAKLPNPAGAVMMSGGFDLSWASPSVHTNSRRDVAIGPRGLAMLQQWYRPSTDVRDPLVSPVFGDFTGLPPMLFQTGDTEVLRDDSVRAAERARAAGVTARLEVYPLAPHAWQQLGTWLPETRTALHQISDFAKNDCGFRTDRPPLAIPQPRSPL
jgi:monoterpene epsilon-lactone hydrolase